MYKVVIIDDEISVRKGLNMYLNTLGDDFEVVASLEDGKEAIEYLKKFQ